MTRTLRLSTIAIATLVAAIGAAACSSSDPPEDSTTATGGATSANTTAAGGNTSATTAATGNGTGGAVTPGGGSDAGGATSTSTDAGGAPATGGATSGSTEFEPLCGLTIAGVEAKKNAACVAEDVQLCYRTCGPQSVGFKPETCTGGVYTEPSNTCNYPASGDYTCYKVPATLPDAATCGITAAPQSGAACTAPECTLCSLAGAYLDSSSASKVGYCVCQTKTDGSRTWSCAGANIWPCPGHTGC